MKIDFSRDDETMAVYEQACRLFLDQGVGGSSSTSAIDLVLGPGQSVFVHSSHGTGGVRYKKTDNARVLEVQFIVGRSALPNAGNF